jgi:lysophospholipase L1-like esterase
MTKHMRAFFPAIPVIVAVLLSGACGSATSPLEPDPTVRREEQPPPADSLLVATALQAKQDFPFLRILCFGDSLTYGTTLRAAKGLPALSPVSALSPVEGYVPKLARLLASEHSEKIKLINSGIGGETTAGGLARLDGELLIYRPDLVLILEGAVDIGSEDPPYGEIRRNLEGMMRLVLRRDAAVIIGTVPPFNPEGFRAGGSARVKRLNEIIRPEAKALRVRVADHEKAFGKDLALQGPDGVHPNDSGYEMMAETWFEAINDLVAARSK